MDTIPLVLLAVAALIVALIVWQLTRKRRPALPYTKRPSLLTTGELRFYRHLLQAVPSGVMVFIKVRLLDVVSVPENAWREHGAPASGMHLDFVLADAAMAPLLVIELDDKSHALADRQKRDAFKDATLASVGIPILRVKVVSRYDTRELRARIDAALN